MSKLLRLGRRGLTLRWQVLVWVARQLYNRGKVMHGRLSPSERDELRHLLAKSRGRRANLGATEQRRLREIVTQAARGRGSGPGT